MHTYRPINIELLKSTLHYEPTTGSFYRINPRTLEHNLIVNNSVQTNKRNAILIYIDKEHYYAHRLAWAFYYNTDIMEKKLTHINGNVRDNRIENLQLHAKDEILNKGKKVQPPRHKYVGCTYSTRARKYVAFVGKKYLGIYVTLDMAKAARDRYLIRFPHPSYPISEIAHTLTVM